MIVKRFAVGLLALSAAGLIALTGLEDYAPRAVIPVPGDAPTAGWGHRDKRMAVGTYASVQQSLQWLKADTSVAEQAVKRCTKVPLTPYEYDAYVLFAFNVGGNAYCTSTLVKKLNAGQYEAACDQLARWVYAGGVKYKGLEARRMKEMLICKQGVYPP